MTDADTPTGELVVLQLILLGCVQGMRRQGIAPHVHGSSLLAAGCTFCLALPSLSLPTCAAPHAAAAAAVPRCASWWPTQQLQRTGTALTWTPSAATWAARQPWAACCAACRVPSCSAAWARCCRRRSRQASSGSCCCPLQVRRLRLRMQHAAAPAGSVPRSCAARAGVVQLLTRAAHCCASLLLRVHRHAAAGRPGWPVPG